jgi:hypothetical protein
MGGWLQALIRLRWAVGFRVLLKRWALRRKKGLLLLWMMGRAEELWQLAWSRKGVEGVMVWRALECAESSMGASSYAFASLVHCFTASVCFVLTVLSRIMM